MQTNDHDPYKINLVLTKGGSMKNIFKKIAWPFVWLWFKLHWVQEPRQGFKIKKFPLMMIFEGDLETFQNIKSVCYDIESLVSDNQPDIQVLFNVVNSFPVNGGPNCVEIRFTDFDDKNKLGEYDYVKDSEKNVLPRSIHRISMKRGLSGDDFKIAFAHETGHLLGHWNHGTCFLMQPKICLLLGYKYLLNGFGPWLRLNYGRK